MTVVAVVVVRVVIAGIEVQIPRVVRIICVERTRPVVSVGTGIFEIRFVAIAGSRQAQQ